MERRGSAHSLECIVLSNVRSISSEAAPNRQGVILSSLILEKICRPVIDAMCARFAQIDTKRTSKRVFLTQIPART